MTAPSVYIYTLLRQVHTEKESYLNNNPKHTYSTRNETQLLIYPTHKTKLLEKSTTYMEMKLFNKLPKLWKDLENRKFLNLIKTFLIGKAYYSVQEFLAESDFVNQLKQC